MDSRDRSALIIRDENNKILIGHAINKPIHKGWDLIKGHIEYGENPEEGAVREAKEEAGLDLNIEDLDLLGSFRYQGGDVFIFETHLKYKPRLVCTSYFTWRGKEIPELSDFEWVDESQLEDKLYPGLYSRLKSNGFLKN